MTSTENYRKTSTPRLAYHYYVVPIPLRYQWEQTGRYTRQISSLLYHFLPIYSND